VFVDLEATADPTRWHLPLAPRLLTNSGAIQGGAVFGAALQALERAAARPLVWASAQFLRHAGPDGTLDLDVDLAVTGHQVSQAVCTVRLAGAAVLTAVGALGSRPFEAGGVWVAPPDVPDPDDLALLDFPLRGTGSIVDHVDIRPAHVLVGTGRSALWCRVGECRGDDGRVGVDELAIVADLSVLALAEALDRRVVGNSLDNTIRLVSRDAAGWVLLDVTVEAIHDGFAHVTARLWSEHRRLLATASQTLVLREADDHGRAVRTSRRIVGGA
jgi:acyl-CoA thioesterase